MACYCLFLDLIDWHCPLRWRIGGVLSHTTLLSPNSPPSTFPPVSLARLQSEMRVTVKHLQEKALRELAEATEQVLLLVRRSQACNINSCTEL